MKLSIEELKLVELGSVRFNRKLEQLAKLDIPSGVGNTLIRAALSPVARRIELNYMYNKQQPEIAVEQLAFIGLSVVISSLSPETKFTSLVYKIGKAIEDEVNAQTFDIKEGLTRTQLVSALRKYDPIKQTKAYRLRLGTLVLEAIDHSTNLLSIYNKRIGRRTFKLVDPSDDYILYHDQFIRDNQYSEPLKKPITSFPIQFNDELIGGYAFNVLSNTSVLKYKNRKQLAKLDGARISQVLNTIQSVPYEINSRVLDVAWELYTTSKAIAGLPAALEPLPKQTEDEPDKHFHKRYYQAKESNNSMLGKRFNTARTLMIAREFKEESHFYYPVELDFRGRIYYSSDHLQPQGDSLSKALLLFKSRAIIEDPYFYYCSGANLYGYDKLSYYDKYTWVRSNLHVIQAIAEAPMKHLDLWEGCDDPFGFLAFCFDCNEYLKDPDNYESGLRISLDASASGLGIISLLVRDIDAMKQVNVVQ